MTIFQINQTVQSHISKATEAASYLWQREWAERNGGNISINITKIIGILPDSFDQFRYIKTKGYPKEAAGMVIFVSGTGERLRELTIPENSACIIRFTENADGYHIIWGGLSHIDFRPTSELITHIKIHVNKEKTGSQHIAVIHTHPLELISLSHHPKYGNDKNEFKYSCWKMLPEVRAFCPKGIGLIPYLLPGSEKIADKTVDCLIHNDVAVWAKHGAVATGKDALEAFDFIDVANKGAKLFLMCLAAGFEPTGLSMKEIDELVRTFDL